MADSKKVKDAKKATSNSANVTAEEVKTKITVHLDRDPNDPRNVKEADKLPSLND